MTSMISNVIYAEKSFLKEKRYNYNQDTTCTILKGNYTSIINNFDTKITEVGPQMAKSYEDAYWPNTLSIFPTKMRGSEAK